LRATANRNPPERLPMPVPFRLSLLLAALTLAGCVNLAPHYEAPAVDTPVAFKEGNGVWVAAAPADALERGPWWTLFDDPVLGRLESQVEVSNQNVAAAIASYEQARAITREQNATLFPTVNLNSSNSRSGGGGNTPTRGSHSLGIGASWEPDVFGRLRLGVESARFGEQAAEADLAAARLASQGQLATSYFGLRQTDIFISLQAQTLAGYQRSLQITRNRYQAGIVARTDVLQAESQLANSQADLLSLQQQRANFEHAIAVLVGKAPADFSLPPDPKWSARVPPIPPEVPSTLLQRRPDIAAAERAVAQANAQIGIARAGYFPNITLNGSAGFNAASFGELFNASSFVWAVGSSLAQTLFNGGATTARVEQTRAALDLSAARYRQTVLTAFQNVEDELAAVRILTQQQSLRLEASRAADLVEQQVLNRYQAGQVNYTEVITAQQNAAAARRALVTSQLSHEIAAVSLIQALGGGWRGLGTTAAR
jgi:NodT family efflux transporter outer membrane factor (OMF) lipoprotein